MASAVEKKLLTETVEIGKTFVLKDGTRLVAERRKKEKKKEKLSASETAVHEAKHAVVAWKRGRRVLFLTVVPGTTPDGVQYLGLTMTDGYDPVAAAAPHADGHSGTAGDRANMAAHGHDIEDAGGAARSIMTEAEEAIVAVANAVNESGSLGETAFNTIMEMVEENKDTEYEVVVTLYPPEGKPVEHNVVPLPKKGDVITITDLPITHDHEPVVRIAA